jgi:hypothetical protein
MIEMLERWVHLHLPSRQSIKRKKRRIINHFSSSSTASLHHPIMPASYKQHANRRLINTSCIRSHPFHYYQFYIPFSSWKKKNRPFFFLFSLSFIVG